MAEYEQVIAPYILRIHAQHNPHRHSGVGGAIGHLLEAVEYRHWHERR